MRKMKDSGVEWIGEIPDEWSMRRFAHIIERMGTGLNPRDNFSLDKDSPYYYVTIRNFKNGILYLDDECDRIDQNAFDIIQERSQLQEGDFLFASISKDAQAYLITETPKNWNINESVFCFRPKKTLFESRYLYYVITNYRFYESLLIEATGSTFFSIKQNKLKQSFLVVPPLSEQERIAAYLDKRCGAIERLIANQEEQIEKLKSYKQSLITETVTRGLDPTVPMKDSMLDVYPYVPQHWNVQKTLSILKMPITDGPHTTPELFPEGIPFVSAEAVSCGNGSIDFEHIRGFISNDFYDECCKKYIPQKNDIFMIKSGATTGRVSVVDTDKIFTIWSPLAVFRTNPRLMYFRFLYYFLQSVVYQRQVQFGWTYGTQQNIGMRTLENLKVFVPPLSEQSRIAEYLDKRCGEIDKLVAIKEAKIERLREYKKSLIFEYVTGKRKVV